MCTGKSYQSKCTIKCTEHAALFEAECLKRAESSASVIHPVLKRAHSNKPEAINSVIAKMRKKGTNLERTHYETKTNIGILEANRSSMYRFDPQYDWVARILENLGLPVFPSIIAFLEKTREERRKKLAAIQSEDSKKKRIERKKKRQEEQERKKAFTREQEKMQGELGYGSASQEQWASFPHLIRVGQGFPSIRKAFQFSEPALAVVFDLETSGFSNSDDIIQFACSVIHYDGQRFQKPQNPSSFASYVNSTRDLSKSQKIHGITPPMLSGAPSFPSVMNDFLAFLEKFPAETPMILISHNLKFDYRMLQKNCLKRGINLEASLMSKISARVCSLELSRSIPKSSFPTALALTPTAKKPSFSLGSVYHAITGKQLEKAHDALGDVEGLIEVVVHPLFSEVWKGHGEAKILPLPSPPPKEQKPRKRKPCQCGRLRHSKVKCPFHEARKREKEEERQKKRGKRGKPGTSKDSKAVIDEDLLPSLSLLFGKEKLVEEEFQGQSDLAKIKEPPEEKEEGGGGEEDPSTFDIFSTQLEEAEEEDEEGVVISIPSESESEGEVESFSESESESESGGEMEQEEESKNHQREKRKNLENSKETKKIKLSIPTPPQDPVTQDHYLWKDLADSGGTALWVYPDGNCFYRSISVLLYGSEDRWNELKRACCETMKRHCNEFSDLLKRTMEEDFEFHYTIAEKNGAYARGPQLVAMATHIARPILVLGVDQVLPLCSSFLECARKHRDQHQLYSPINFKGNVDSCSEPLVIIFTKRSPPDQVSTCDHFVPLIRIHGRALLKNLDPPVVYNDINLSKA